MAMRLKEKDRLAIIADFIKGQPRSGYTVTETDGRYRVRRDKPTDPRSALELKRDRLRRKLEEVEREIAQSTTTEVPTESVSPSVPAGETLAEHTD